MVGREKSIVGATGKRRNLPQSSVSRNFFGARDKLLTQVAIAWVLARPEVTSPLVGATSPEQLKQSLPAVDLTLDAEEMDVCNDVWFSLPRVRDKAVALR